MPLSRLEKLFDEGLGALRRERYNEASDRFGEVMELDPELPEVHYNMGLALGRLYRWRDARECFRMAVRLEPRVVFWVHLGLASLHLRRWEDALAAFDGALALDPASDLARAHAEDLRTFLASADPDRGGVPFLCAGWFDPRLDRYVGIDPEIVPKARRRELRAYLARELDGPGACDHTHTLTEEWAFRHGLDPLGVSRFLYQRGMCCDCQVLAEADRP